MHRTKSRDSVHKPHFWKRKMSRKGDPNLGPSRQLPAYQLSAFTTRPSRLTLHEWESSSCGWWLNSKAVLTTRFLGEAFEVRVLKKVLWWGWKDERWTECTIPERSQRTKNETLIQLLGFRLIVFVFVFFSPCLYYYKISYQFETWVSP